MEEPLTTLCDNETFARVWRRVMPTPTPGCPIALLADLEPHQSPPATTSPTTTDVAMCPTTAPEPMVTPSAIVPTQPISTPAPRVETVPIPTHHQEPCLGFGLEHQGAQLQALIDHALAEARRYQQLSRKQKHGSRTLAVLYNQRKKHAKKLSAAYFLLSGVRYWPQEQPVTPLRTPYAATLRQCYYGAQRSEGVYTTAALEAGEGQLKDLYLTLAQEMTHHGTLLWYLLEQVL